MDRELPKVGELWLYYIVKDGKRHDRSLFIVTSIDSLGKAKYTYWGLGQGESKQGSGSLEGLGTVTPYGRTERLTEAT